MSAGRIVAGEASESDDEEVVADSKPTETVKKGTIVLGEASESDDDAAAEEFPSPVLPVPVSIPPLEVMVTTTSNASMSTSNSWQAQPQTFHDTLLHRKLRETNASFHDHLVNFVRHQYSSSASELQTLSQGMKRSLASIQDVSHNMRLITNNLFRFEDKLDIIVNCSILPELKLPSTNL